MNYTLSLLLLLRIYFACTVSYAMERSSCSIYSHQETTLLPPYNYQHLALALHVASVNDKIIRATKKAKRASFVAYSPRPPRA
jgi:hypothetical protein